MVIKHTFLGDLDCTPPDDSLCADVEYGDMDSVIHHYYPCKLASIVWKLYCAHIHIIKEGECNSFNQTKNIECVTRRGI